MIVRQVSDITTVILSLRFEACDVLLVLDMQLDICNSLIVFIRSW